MIDGCSSVELRSLGSGLKISGAMYSGEPHTVAALDVKDVHCFWGNHGKSGYTPHQSQLQYDIVSHHILSYLKSFATKSELSVWAHVRTYSIKYIKFQYHTQKYSENPWVQFVNPKFLTCSSNLHHPCISMYGRSRSI